MDLLITFYIQLRWKKEYLKRLLAEENYQSDNLSDSKDEDWLPNDSAPNSSNAEASNNEDYVDGGT